MDTISRRKAGHGIRPMLMQSHKQVGRYANIERSTRLTGENVYARLLAQTEIPIETLAGVQFASAILIRQASTARRATWMLKQVQHDDQKKFAK